MAVVKASRLAAKSRRRKRASHGAFATDRFLGFGPHISVGRRLMDENIRGFDLEKIRLQTTVRDDRGSFASVST
jgi:hypothetical protein